MRKSKSIICLFVLLLVCCSCAPCEPPAEQEVTVRPSPKFGWMYIECHAGTVIGGRQIEHEGSFIDKRLQDALLEVNRIRSETNNSLWETEILTN